MPDFWSQFDPPAGDYDLDFSLADMATFTARERIAAGEPERDVVLDVISRTVRAYLGTPWTCWHPRLKRFLTHSEAANLDYLIWMENRETSGKQ